MGEGKRKAVRPGTELAIDCSRRALLAIPILPLRRVPGHAGVAASLRSKGDRFDRALAETLTGLSKTEVIERRDPWGGPNDVEIATFEWVYWFINPRLA